MNTILDVAYLLLGGLVLYVGAEWLVKGSSGLARAFGVRPLIVGLTVVAYGTSAPELAVSAAAILEHSSPIVLGNVVGSCIANLGLILGTTAVIAPPSVDARLIKREVPVLLASVIALPLALLGGAINRIEALFLAATAVGFTAFTLARAADQHATSVDMAAPTSRDEPAGHRGKIRLAAVTGCGLALLIVGAELFVHGAKGLAYDLGMSELLVGLTIVAVGTSLPELAASIVAAIRGYPSIAVGNVIGSNIFNIFLILGVVAQIRPIDGSLAALKFDLGFMAAITLLAVLFMRGARRVNRIEGAVLLLAYAVFLVLTILGW